MMSRRLRPQSLRAKFGLLLTGFMASLSLIVLLDAGTAGDVGKRLHELRTAFPAYAYADQIGHRLDGLFSLYDTFVMTGSPSVLDEFEAESGHIATMAGRLSEYLPLDERARVARLRVQLARYTNAADDLAGRLTAAGRLADGPFRDPEFSARYLDLAGLKMPLKETSNTLLQDRKDLLDRTTFVTLAEIERRTRVSLGLAVLASAVAAWVMAGLARRIVRPIRSLAELAGGISLGNLDLETDLPRFEHDEIGKLAQAFGRMVEGLRNTMVSRDRFDAIVQSMGDALLVVSPDGRIRMANPAAARLLDHPPDTLPGIPLAEILEPDGEGALLPPGDPEGPLVTGQERVYRASDGRRIPVLFSASRLGGLGSEAGVVCVARDISERLEARRLNRELREKAEAASRAKTSFLASMSHEIRTPLNGVIGMSELLMDTPLDAEQRGYARTITGCGQALLTVVNDILDISRIEAGRVDLNPVPFDLRGLLEDTVEIMSPKAREKELALDLSVARSVPPALVGDPGRLRQILINLLNNALRFTEEGGVRLSAEPAPQAGGLGTAIHFRVSDTGIGIAPEQQAAVFEPFRQADGSIASRYGGSGLGLAISKQLVELMGGRLGLESGLGRGSTFYFTIPFVRAVEPVRPAGPGSAPPALDGTRILVADDNEINRMLARTLLEKRGARVTAATTGREALEAASGGAFDLILMDVEMPEMDGLAATRAIREREREREQEQEPVPGPRVPIVAMTAHAATEDRDRCLAAGMDGYLSKPIRREALWRAIRDARAGIRRLLLDEGPAAAAVFDESAALAHSGGDADLLRDMIAVFLEQAPEAAARARRALAAGDAAELRGIGHKLKGMASTLGAGPTAAAAGRVEEAASRGPEASGRAVADLERELGAVTEALAGWREARAA